MSDTSYLSLRYNSRTRWMNFWHQVDEVMALKPQRVLEVGAGGGIVRDRLRGVGCEVITVDTDPAVESDVVASIEKLPFPDKSFDVVLAAEVLEHVPFERVPEALRELKRVARHAVVVTLPHAGSAFIFHIKIPLIGDGTFFLKVPFFWKQHANKYGDARGHYWELGKRGYSRARMRTLFNQAGLQVVKERIYPDDIIRICFVLSS